MEIINVTKKEQLDYLYRNSALTLEGTDISNIDVFVKWATDLGADKPEKVYVISGAFMNETYDLTGINAYPDDLTIVSFVEGNHPKVAPRRFDVGARWFDDIISGQKARA